CDRFRARGTKPTCDGADACPGVWVVLQSPECFPPGCCSLKDAYRLITSHPALGHKGSPTFSQASLRRIFSTDFFIPMSCLLGRRSNPNFMTWVAGIP